MELARDIERFLERPLPPATQPLAPAAPPGPPIGEPALEDLRTLEPALLATVMFRPRRVPTPGSRPAARHAA